MSIETIHMLHGAIGSHLDWTTTENYLKQKGFLTKAHDLYDYLQGGVCSFEQFVKEFEGIIDPFEKQNLLGYSLGGRLALHALLESPTLWRKAVIVSAHTGLPEHDRVERENRTHLDQKWAEMVRDKDTPWADFLKKWNQQGVLSRSTSEDLGWSDRLLLESDREYIANSFDSWSLGLQDDLLGKLSQLETPILWIVGESDTKFLEVAMRATNTLPNSKLQVVKNAGHRSPWEQPEEFHSLVSEWFED